MRTVRHAQEFTGALVTEDSRHRGPRFQQENINTYMQGAEYLGVFSIFVFVFVCFSKWTKNYTQWDGWASETKHWTEKTRCKREFKELERSLNKYEHLMPSQGTQVWFLAPSSRSAACLLIQLQGIKHPFVVSGQTCTHVHIVSHRYTWRCRTENNTNI